MKLITLLISLAFVFVSVDTSLAKDKPVSVKKLKRGQVWSVKSEKYPDVRVTILSAKCPEKHRTYTHIKLTDYPKVNEDSLKEEISNLAVVAEKLVPSLDKIIADESETLPPISPDIMVFWDKAHYGHYRNTGPKVMNIGVEKILDRLLPFLKSQAENQRQLKVILTQFENAPSWLDSYSSLTLKPLRPLSSSDGSQYILSELVTPIVRAERTITHFVVGARMKGEKLRKGAKDLPVNIAIVTDNSLLDDDEMDFEKGEFIAHGIGSVIDVQKE